MKLILEFLEFTENRDRAEKLMREFLAFLEGKKLQKVSITLEESSQEVEFDLTEEEYRVLAYAAYQLEIPVMNYFQITLRQEAERVRRKYEL